MRTVAIAIFAGLALAGCSSSSSGDDTAVKDGAGVIQNPGGKPQNQEQANLATQMQQQGGAMNDQRAKDAAAMLAAQKNAGGK